MNTEPKAFEIPGKLQRVAGPGGLPLLRITGGFSAAEICLHGGQVTHFQKNGEHPLLFLSQKSDFAAGKAIRGGIPVCFPWFGPRQGKPSHGVARLAAWEITGSAVDEAGRVTVKLALPPARLTEAGWPAAQTSLTVTVAEHLTLKLLVQNHGSQDFVHEACLHTYLAVGDIAEVEIRGLKGAWYLDKVDFQARKQETHPAIRIAGETDRVYMDTTGPVEVWDGRWRRRVTVTKGGSLDTVVWNPWVDKAKALPDFGDEEYRGMVCVESGNVGQNIRTVPPGGQDGMWVTLESRMEL